MSCKVIRDEHGALYRVPAFAPALRSNLRVLPPRPHVDLWWDRDAKHKSNEDLYIRQDNGTRADVIVITQGQLYDLIHAANCLVKDI